jgi:hypothetical protein
MTLRHTLRHELESFAATGREAFRIIETLFDGIVTALRRDQRFANISLRELELLLADKRCEAEQHLFAELRDRVHLDDVDYVNGDGE